MGYAHGSLQERGRPFLAAFCPRSCSRIFCSTVSLPMLASYENTRRVISLGMIYPGLLTALMVAATPKQIAMARQMVNSESHILRHPSHVDAPNRERKRLSHVLVPRN